MLKYIANRKEPKSFTSNCKKTEWQTFSFFFGDLSISWKKDARKTLIRDQRDPKIKIQEEESGFISPKLP